MTSLYSKDELPTYEELHTFFTDKIFRYDVDDPSHQTLDIYWNIPYRKILISQVCNQLNKMVHEDGKGSNYMYGHNKLKPLIRFILMEDNENTALNNYKVELIPPEIYTSIVPSTKKYSIFIVNNHPRFDIGDIRGSFTLVADVSHANYHFIFRPEDDEYIKLITHILTEPIKYYEEPMGWK